MATPPLSLPKLLKISRPRFWIYLAGTFALGVVYGVPPHGIDMRFFPMLILFFLWFTLPANFFLYGVNDLYDYETDKLNPKKHHQETLVEPQEHDTIKGLSSIMVSLGLILSMYYYALFPALFMILFLFMSFFYSAPPLRMKSRPGLDSIFNILYCIPGLIGYTLIAHILPPVWIIIAAGLWCMSMHAYSAIPDISSDKSAGIATIATTLEAKSTLMFVGTGYLITSMVISFYSLFCGIVLFVYPLFIGIHFFLPEQKIQTLYWYFPLINALIGGILFWYKVVQFI